MPTLFCHRLIVENYRIVAAGDSYNDTAMLGAADAGFLFHAPDNVIKEFPQFKALHEFAELLEAIRNSLHQ
jgi:phosphoserine/homoserine phosphotransferase